jgi:hypothetical protein
LWISGKPGYGKSVLTASIIRDLKAKGAITVYFFCRSEDDSKRTFASILRTWLWQLLEGKVHTIRLTNKDTKNDLEQWTRARLSGLQLCDGYLEKLAPNKLRDGADGMFLWVHFQLQALEAQVKPDNAKAVMEELPSGLEATYERLLNKVLRVSDNRRQTIALRILQLMTAVTRSLNLAELDYAISIQIDSAVSPKGKTLLRGAVDILDTCGAWVEITKTEQVRLVHTSAKDFLSSKGMQFGLVDHMPTEPAQKAITAMHVARACLTCLSFSDIGVVDVRMQFDSMTLLREHLKQNPFWRTPL